MAKQPDAKLMGLSDDAIERRRSGDGCLPIVHILDRLRCKS
jgi:hypothetical protein